MTAPRPLTPPRVEWRLEHAPTDDGWDLALYRYEGGRTDVPPVILCSGFACTHHFFDFDDRYSLARYLARRGFDAWALELRGRGASLPARASARRTWTFDDLASLDFPAAVRHVAARTGRRPAWVGHSMGGLLGYAALGSDPSRCGDIAGLVTMASPTVQVPAGSHLVKLVGEGLLATSSRHLPQRRALTTLWLLARSSPRMLEVGMNTSNVDRRAFGRALRRFICDVPAAKLRQFVRWSRTGSFGSADGRIDYRSAMGRITVPALIAAGAGDRLAPPDSVRPAYDAIASEHKSYREFSLANGDAADYGHIDLVFGKRAPDEVFAAVASWLEALPKEG
ncbi:MAG: alpha/beta fold hydrolase [Actinomycetota bacterium]